jgi:hypothetical protein
MWAREKFRPATLQCAHDGSVNTILQSLDNHSSSREGRAQTLFG